MALFFQNAGIDVGPTILLLCAGFFSRHHAAVVCCSRCQLQRDVIQSRQKNEDSVLSLKAPFDPPDVYRSALEGNERFK